MSNRIKCQTCDGARLCYVRVKSSDQNILDLPHASHQGYVPRDMNIGGDDYLRMIYCLDCGQIQGDWPLPPTGMEATDDGWS